MLFNELFYAILLLFAKKKYFYECPNCKFDEVETKTTHCPNCKMKLDWSDVKKNN